MSSVRFALSVFLAAGLVAAASAQAQSSSDRDDYERVGLGLGAGVVDTEIGGEIYYTAALRFALSDDDRGSGRRRQGANREMQAFLEPEVGYWESSDENRKASDLSAGLNAVGVIPGARVDYLLGIGGAVHFIDSTVTTTNGGVQVQRRTDDTHLGGNFHFGLDLRMSDTVSVFGVGRVDLIEGTEDTVQGKVYFGLRLHF